MYTQKTKDYLVCATCNKMLKLQLRVKLQLTTYPFFFVEQAKEKRLTWDAQEAKVLEYMA